MKHIYLDNAATTPMAQPVIDKMTAVMTQVLAMHRVLIIMADRRVQFLTKVACNCNVNQCQEG